MKFINDCLVLNKADTDAIIPILNDDLTTNSLMYARHVDKIQELPQVTLEYCKDQIKILVPFFHDWMLATGKLTDSEYKQMKQLSAFDFALQVGRREIEKRAKLRQAQGGQK